MLWSCTTRQIHSNKKHAKEFSVYKPNTKFNWNMFRNFGDETYRPPTTSPPSASIHDFLHKLHESDQLAILLFSNQKHDYQNSTLHLPPNSFGDKTFLYETVKSPTCKLYATWLTHTHTHTAGIWENTLLIISDTQRSETGEWKPVGRGL